MLNPEFLKRRVEAWYIPEYHYGHRFLEIEEENALKAADEIPIDETSLELLGLEKKEGQKVTLSFYADAADYSMTGMINMDVNFSNSFGIEEKMNRVDLESGYSLNKNDKNYIASNVNWAFLPEGMTADPSTVTALVAGTVLILLTGYLIIQYLPYIRNPGYSVLWALKDNWYDRASGEAHPAQASSAREFLHCLIKLTLFEIFRIKEWVSCFPYFRVSDNRRRVYTYQLFCFHGEYPILRRNPLLPFFRTPSFRPIL